MPALNVTVYVNEADRREQQPINCRAMAIWWLHTANPMHHPIILGDVVMTGIAEDGGGTDVPDVLFQDIFEAREFVVQICPPRDNVWYDTFARFADVFDAATWCLPTPCTRQAPSGSAAAPPRSSQRASTTLFGGVMHRGKGATHPG